MKKTVVCIIGLTLLLLSSNTLAQDSSSGEGIYDIQQDAAVLSAGVDMTLKIAGIDGESLITGHEDEIDILSWSWGMSQAGTMHVGGGGGTGKVDIEDISLVKYVDKSSASLMLACASGAHLAEAVLTVRKSGANPLDYLVITMSPVLVTSVSTGGSSGEYRLTENITLNCSKIKVSYTPQKADGSADASVDFNWNIETNTE
jgi:type VI secretion system secreted protein Hcp